MNDLTETNETTLLIDSNYIAHQARYTMKGLSNKDIPTGILFGFLNRILYLGKMFRTNDFVFFWDSKKSLRKRIYPEYKSQRRSQQTAEEAEQTRIAFEQFDIIRSEILPIIGFRNIIRQTGYESDDTIASVVMNKLGKFVVVSADEDLYQLLDYCSMYNPQKDFLFTAVWYELQYNLKPHTWSKVKAIAGCKSDNVKGIEGVGTKTAVKYLNNALKKTTKTFQSIESSEGKKIIERNIPLVRLPFKNTKEPVLTADQFSSDLFFDLCEQYGFESFLKAEKMTAWENFFKGDFDTKKYTHKARNLTAKDFIRNRRKKKKRK